MYEGFVPSNFLSLRNSKTDKIQSKKNKNKNSNKTKPTSFCEACNGPGWEYSPPHLIILQARSYVESQFLKAQLSESLSKTTSYTIVCNDWLV